VLDQRAGYHTLTPYFAVDNAGPEMGSSSPKTIGDSPVGVLIYVEDVDAAFAQAVEAGAEMASG
jgi:uncharacterized glyoxalase superfamily protein PhnB